MPLHDFGDRRRAYLGCVERSWRLARWLGVSEDEAEPIRADETTDDRNYIGFPYRPPCAAKADLVSSAHDTIR